MCSSFLPSARHFQPQRLDLQMIILPTTSKLSLTYREKQRAVTFFTQRCNKCKRMWKSVVFLSFAIRRLFPTSFLSVFLSSSSSSSPVTSHLFALRLSAFHTFSGTTYLSEQTQNALQRCCERYLPLPQHLLAHQLDTLHYFQHVLQSISELISQFKVLGIMGNAGCVRVHAPELGH